MKDEKRKPKDVIRHVIAARDCFAVYAGWDYDKPDVNQIEIEFRPVPAFALAVDGADDQFQFLQPFLPVEDSDFYSIDDHGEAANYKFLGLWYAREGKRDDEKWRAKAIARFKREQARATS